MFTVKILFKFSRPINLLFLLLAYALGAGLAHYLGAEIFYGPLFLGGAILLFTAAASSLLLEYFRPENEPFVSGENPINRNELRLLLLVISLLLLTTEAAIIYIININGFLGIEAIIIIGLFIVLGVFLAVPPVRLVNRGLGELVMAFEISCLGPSFAFFLFSDAYHRILIIFTFPLFLLYLAYYLALNFPSYRDDIKYERSSLLSVLSWQRAVPIHNMLIATAFLFYAIVPFFGVSVNLIWPLLLILPVGIYQIHSLWKIADGARPDWKLFIFTATMTAGLTTYLLLITFWLK